MSLRSRLALLTYSALPDLWREDRRLIPEFARYGIHGEPAVWSDPATRWEDFDAVLIRSCWDYFLDYPAFIRLLDRLDAARIPVFNPSDVIRWNSNKRYLLDLERAGVRILPTEIVTEASVHDLDRVAALRGWTRAVVKPCVSASGYDTHAVSLPLDGGAREAIAPALARGPALVQEFAPEVTRDGEHSLIFIAGRFSHAVLKRARPGEFRVQVEHGGSVEPRTVPDWMIEQAAGALAAAGRNTFYARVDGIARDDRFVLMELELVEPNLYLEFAPDAAGRLVDAVALELGVA